MGYRTRLRRHFHMFTCLLPVGSYGHRKVWRSDQTISVNHHNEHNNRRDDHASPYLQYVISIEALGKF